MSDLNEDNSFLDLLDNQLREGFPPEARETYDLLLAQNYPPEYARLLIGNLLARDIHSSLKTKGMWEMYTYVAALQQLQDEEMKAAPATPEVRPTAAEMRRTRLQQVLPAIHAWRVRRT